MKAISRIYEYLDYMGIKPSKFEEKNSLSNGYLGKQKKRDANLGEGILNKILDNCPDINPYWLLTGKGNMLSVPDSRSGYVKPAIINEPNGRYSTIKEVPLYDFTASAGVVEIFNDSNSAIPMDHIKIPDLPDCDGAIHINGDSMYPLLKSGDIIMYKQVNNKENIIWGEMYLMYINNHGDEFFFVKYIQKSDKEGYVKLVSQNQHHQPVEFPIDSIKQIAIVKASVRINSRV